MLSAIPRGLGRDEWLQALPRALVAGFVKTDKEFQSRGMKLALSLVSSHCLPCSLSVSGLNYFQTSQEKRQGLLLRLL